MDDIRVRSTYSYENRIRKFYVRKACTFTQSVEVSQYACKLFDITPTTLVNYSDIASDTLVNFSDNAHSTLVNYFDRTPTTLVNYSDITHTTFVNYFDIAPTTFVKYSDQNTNYACRLFTIA